MKTVEEVKLGAEALVFKIPLNLAQLWSIKVDVNVNLVELAKIAVLGLFVRTIPTH